MLGLRKTAAKVQIMSKGKQWKRFSVTITYRVKAEFEKPTAALEKKIWDEFMESWQYGGGDLTDIQKIDVVELMS